MTTQGGGGGQKAPENSCALSDLKSIPLGSSGLTPHFLYRMLRILLSIVK